MEVLDSQRPSKPVEESTMNTFRNLDDDCGLLEIQSFQALEQKLTSNLTLIKKKISLSQENIV